MVKIINSNDEPVRKDSDLFNLTCKLYGNERVKLLGDIINGFFIEDGETSSRLMFVQPRLDRIYIYEEKTLEQAYKLAEMYKNEGNCSDFTIIKNYS